MAWISQWSDLCLKNGRSKTSHISKWLSNWDRRTTSYENDWPSLDFQLYYIILNSNKCPADLLLNLIFSRSGFSMRNAIIPTKWYWCLNDSYSRLNLAVVKFWAMFGVLITSNLQIFVKNLLICTLPYGSNKISGNSDSWSASRNTQRPGLNGYQRFWVQIYFIEIVLPCRFLSYSKYGFRGQY